MPQNAYDSGSIYAQPNSGALQTMKLARVYDNRGDPIANNFVHKGGDVNSSMQSQHRSAMKLGDDYDSNASASFIAFNEIIRSTNQILNDSISD